MSESNDYFELAKVITNEQIIYDHMKKRIHDLETALTQIQELCEPATDESKWQIHIILDICRDNLKRVE